MINDLQQPPERSGLKWFQKILLILMALLVVVCIGVVAMLHFGYSIPGLKLPPYLSFLIPPPTGIPLPVRTAAITPIVTNTPFMTPTPTRTAVPTYTMLPTSTKAPTWTLLPIFMTQSVTPLPPVTPTVTGTPPTATITP
ncbi:MAG: hypothetical protein ABSA23_11915 [Anaerolineales bacterium]